MQKKMTVGELRKALENVPDELEVHFSSDTEESYEIILEKAQRVTYTLPNGQVFEDTGENGVDYFEIYGNAAEEEDEIEVDEERAERLAKLSADAIETLRHVEEYLRKQEEGL